MAYDSSKPANGGSLVSADIRENFRALKEDGIVVAADLVAAKKDPIAATAGLRTLGTGAQQAMPGNATPTPADASISQAKLKTSIGSVGGTGGNYTLPGGEYGFYPQIKASGTSGANVSAHIGANLVTLSYTTNIALASNVLSFAQQRYVTSSGEVHWVFILRDKTTKNTLAMYQAPDHPCFGNGGKPLLVPHPFVDYDPKKHEIIVINPSDEDIFNMQDACIMPEDKPDRDILEVIMEDYEIDEDLQTEWPKKEITVGLPKNIDWKRMPEGSKVVPVRKRIPQPSYVTTRKLWKKK
jgi:hypothetical protein